MTQDLLEPVAVERLGVIAGHGSPYVMSTAHRHEEVELNFVPRGYMAYLFGGTRETIQEGQLGVFWAAIPHRLTGIEDGTLYSLLTVPLGWFLQRGFPAWFSHRLLNGELLRDTPNADPLDHPIFLRWVSDLTNASVSKAESERIVLLEVEARLWRLVRAQQGLDETKASATDKEEMGLVEKMAAFIAGEYQNQICIEDVANTVGLHPNYAMTLFRQSFGITLLEYLTQTRLAHAQRLLVTTNANVVDIAFASGFNSVSRFYAAFQKAQGCAPLTYRGRLAESAP